MANALRLKEKSVFAVGVAEGERAPLRIVSRSEWFARPPERESNLLELPCVRVIIAHTATYEMATTQVQT